MQSGDLLEIYEKFPDYMEKVSKNYQWNFIFIMLDSSFFSFALAILSVETILPYFIAQLTDQGIWIGVVSSIYFWGFFFPQLIGAFLVNKQPLRKWTIFWISVAERMGILMIAILVQFIGKLNSSQALILFLIAFAIFSFTNGLIGPAYADFISKNINRNRGFFFGAMNGLGGLIGFGASMIASAILDRYLFPVNLQILFWVAFASSFISPILILNFRETPFPVQQKQIESFWRFVGDTPKYLAKFPIFSKYLVVRSLLGLGLMANSFYAVYAVQRFELTAGTIGIFTMIILLTQSLMSFVWGAIGDRFGFKMVYSLSILFIAFQGFAAMIARTDILFYFIAFCIGSVYAAVRTSDSNIVFEIAPPEETSRFIGMANTILSPVLAVAPLIGGWLVDAFSYATLFLTVLIVAGVAFVSNVLWLPEPRKVKQSRLSSVS